MKNKQFLIINIAMGAVIAAGLATFIAIKSAQRPAVPIVDQSMDNSGGSDGNVNVNATVNIDGLPGVEIATTTITVE